MRVRLLLDGFGAQKIEPRLLDLMDTAGVQVAWFRKPVWLSPFKQNHRCHRKALIVDETHRVHRRRRNRAGMVRQRPQPGEWRDTHVKARGPAVDGIAAAFAQNWAECHDELFDDHDRFTDHPQAGSSIVQVVRGSASIGWQDMQTLIRIMLTSAEQRFRLATAYFAPDTYFVDLLAQPRAAACAWRSSCPARTPTSAPANSPASTTTHVCFRQASTSASTNRR